MNRWLWTCPLTALALAAAILVLWGWTPASAVIVALLLVCPALIVWGALMLRRRPQFPREPVPATRGMPLGWAAPVYDWYCPKLGLGPAFRARTIALGELRPGMAVLEVGCGTGVLTRLAAAAVGPSGQALGIDPAPEMIAIARQKATAGAQFRLGVIEALPFADASFDVVFASAMLHHLPPATKAAGLAEVFRVLRPGGRLVVVDLDRPANPLWWLLFLPLLAWPMTAGNLRGEIPGFLARAGFAPVNSHGRWLRLLSFWTADKGAGS